MSLTKYGDIVEEGDGIAVLKVFNSLLALGTTTLAIEGFKSDGSNFQKIIAVQTHSRVNKTEDDFVDTVHLYSSLDAGVLAGMLMASASKLGKAEAKEFDKGFRLGTTM